MYKTRHILAPATQFLPANPTIRRMFGTQTLQALAGDSPQIPPFMTFPSRRSVVHSTNGIVSCTQPLAAAAGLAVLRAGGNAADAAVAVAAALNVTEPTSTGIGGDAFCLFYDAREKKVRGFNASGRAPRALTLERAREDIGRGFVDKGGKEVLRIPMGHIHAITVPGAAAGWVDVVQKLGSGRVGMGEILGEAIRLSEEGFPVSELSARFWAEGEKVLRRASPETEGELLKGGERPPRVGEVMKMPGLAKVFRKVVEQGKKGFYEGEVAEAVVNAVKERGGVMELADLKEMGERGAEEVNPIGIEWEGVKVWECAPNGQGMVALMALGILEALEKKGVVKPLGGGDAGYGHNETEYVSSYLGGGSRADRRRYLHAVIEALRIAFADGHWWISDPDFSDIPIDGLLNKKYLAERAALFDPHRVNPNISHGSPAFQSTDTVYFSVTDKEGNGCSFINSIFGGFGSGIVPKGCGFVLQNRGAGFSLQKDHPNVLAPGKRPYHTIIPGMVTDVEGKELKAVFGNMGGFMQPQ
jgi:gamma-glutamyltranspeptidase/glutathione hydrolase